jgi:hypothetical protein
MGSLVEELRRREAAARAEADRLRSRIEELAEELARAEEQVTRLVIAREEVARVLEEPAAAEPPAGPAGKPGEPRPAPHAGTVTVPPWHEGTGASVLPQSYQDLMEVAEDAGWPLRAAEFAVAAGLATAKAKVEGLRSKLKLLAARGWLAGVRGGLFTLPDHACRQLASVRCGGGGFPVGGCGQGAVAPGARFDGDEPAGEVLAV